MTTKESTATKPWHTISADRVCADLETNPVQGLAPDEAAQRLALNGPNKLAEKKQRPAWLKFFDQFKNLLVIVLLGAVVLAAAIGDLKDAVVILIVVVFNACLGFYQEYRAEATLAALKKMLRSA